MRHSNKTLLFVLLTVMSFLAVQTVWAQDGDWFTVTGTIIAIDRDISTITIEDDGENKIIIAGFPFGYLERELGDNLGDDDFFINLGDCVTVVYAVVLCKCKDLPPTKNIAIALTFYCDECGGESVNNCYDDEEGIVFRDDDLYPVDKSRHGDDSDQNQHRVNNSGNGG